ncbi:MAG: signal peptide peptidase SppA [Phycisphaerae bacterium]|nr:signal peptide peptidase SppA [Phycisphaerae bacterium]
MNAIARGIVGVLACTLMASSSFAAQTVGFLKLEGELPEREVMAPFLFAKPDGLTFRGVIETLDSVASDPKLSGVVVRLVEPQLSLSRVEEIGAAFRRIRSAGKKVHVFTEIYDQSAVVLGSFADEVIVQSGGAVTLTGVYMEEMFLADMLKWVGVTPDFVQIGDYKGAKEMFANSKPSPEWDQNLNQLLDSMYAHVREHIKSGRKINDQQLDAAMSEGLFMEPGDAVKFGIVDAEADRLGLDDHLKRVYGDDFRWELGLGEPEGAPDFSRMGLFEAFSQIMKALEDLGGGTVRDTIAVVHIDGPIMDGKSSNGSFLSGATVGSLTIREQLKKIEDDDHVKGVIVRINSPGGSAIASESIWLGLRRIAERTKKPVWVSVGSMAASGGYYIAVAGDKIYVNPSSIVGSIGVVGGKLAMGGLYEKLHINAVPRARGPLGGIMSGLAPWTEAERGAITRSMKRTYDQFVDRVTKGRKGIDVSKTAEGRIFTGDKAIALKMADEIGGLDDAVSDMASALKLSDGQFDVLDYPPPMTLSEMFENGLPFGAASPKIEAVESLRSAIGPGSWDAVADAMQALLQLRDEPILLAMPRVVVFR